MAAWALKDAKESFDTVFERASGGEPQIITRSGTPLWVVVSYVDYERKPELKKPSCQKGKKSILEILRSCPCGDELAAAMETGTKAEIPSYFERTGGFGD